MTLFQLRKNMEAQQGHTISAANIAKLSGVSRSQYRRYELGQSVPDLLVASRMAMALNLKLSDLVGVIRATVDKEEELPTPCKN